MTHPVRFEEGRIEGALGGIWYKRFSSGAPGVPILCVHGGPGFMSVTEGLEELVETGRDVIFYDQCGCGRSERPKDSSALTNEYYVSELGFVREELGLGRVHLLAESWGCMLSVEHVLAGAKGVESLILSGPLLSSPAWANDQRALLAGFGEKTRQFVEKCEAEKDFGPAYQEAMMTYYRRHICRLDPWPDYLTDALGRMNTDVYFSLWGHSEFTVEGTLASIDLTGRLQEVKCPVLLTCGEFDEARPETVAGFAQCFPNARVAVIQGASHSHIIEKPEEFRSLVANHLRLASSCDVR